MKINEIINEGKTGPGLWANIHAKRKRGGKMRKPGSKGAPTEKALKAAQAGSKNESVREDEDAPKRGSNIFFKGYTDGYNKRKYNHQAQTPNDEMLYSDGFEQGEVDASWGVSPAYIYEPSAALRKGMAEGSNGEYDDESGMAETNLHTIARAARGLLDTIDSNENLPEWVQEKIAKVEGMMVTAWDYLKSQEEQGVDPRVGVAKGSLNEFAPNNGDEGAGPYDYGMSILKYAEFLKSNIESDDSYFMNDVKTCIGIGNTFIRKGMSNGIAALFKSDTFVYEGILEYLAGKGFNVVEDLISKRGQTGRDNLDEMVSENSQEETYHDDDKFFEAYGVMEYNDAMINESEYGGRKVTLNKPMQGDVKKFKVYVKNPKGNVVKVNFGDPNSTIKKNNPARRKSFRARHNCDNPGPKTGARYWSCRKW